MANITNLKGYLLSTLITFLSVFALVFFGAISVPGFTFSKSSVAALALSAIISAVRAVAKLIVERIGGVATNPVTIPAVSTPTSSTTV